MSRSSIARRTRCDESCSRGASGARGDFEAADPLSVARQAAEPLLARRKRRPWKTATRTELAAASCASSLVRRRRSGVEVEDGISSQKSARMRQTPCTATTRTGTESSLRRAARASNWRCSASSSCVRGSVGSWSGKASMRSVAALRRTCGFATLSARHRMGSYSRSSIESTPRCRFCACVYASTCRSAVAMLALAACTAWNIRSCRQPSSSRSR
mmetsp:Transcript_30559/g.97514  ORF Transcript_30559/g.97514 Transcript_30559/m.97514 type:complete len:215 (+) Transcript_30559:682-1326(+)